MENSNSTRAKVCCFFQTHNMHNIITQCSSIHKFIRLILRHSGPKPVLQLSAPRCPELSVKSHWVTGDSQPDSLTDWSIAQLYRQKAADGCSSPTPRHRGTSTTSAQACWYLLVPRQQGPGSLSLTQCIPVSCQTEQLRTHRWLSPVVAASRAPAGSGWQRTALPHLSFSVPPSPLKHHHSTSHLEPWDSIFFARITAVCK